MNRTLTALPRTWTLREPFVISRGSRSISEVVVTELAEGGHIGRGEAVGVSYHGETSALMLAQIATVRAQIEAGAGRRELLDLLPAGGARNALDAALWDLEAKQRGTTVWQLAGIAPAKSLVTNVTIGIRSIQAYEDRARELARHPWIKIKVGEDSPLEAIEAVRRGAPRAKLVVDANQGWSIATLQTLSPRLASLGVALLEQPMPAGEDEALRDIELSIPVCADEALDTAADLPRLVDLYDFVNIKLDKTGGLTAALDLAHAARAAGMRLMVGCMVASSLAMAPAMVVGQLCEVVDLDGPLLQADDWPDALVYKDGVMGHPSRRLWG